MEIHITCVMYCGDIHSTQTEAFKMIVASALFSRYPTCIFLITFVFERIEHIQNSSSSFKFASQLSFPNLSVHRVLEHHGVVCGTS